MPFVVMDDREKTVTPKYSTAYGELVTGEQVDLGRLRFEKGCGAVEHQHPHEQIIYILEGRLEVTLDGFHAPPNVVHNVAALEDTVILSAKGVVGGVGHKI